ncbi:MAG TPA: Gfo/Idh/MocA family oxidoreductase [Luteitalea sp.]|nr:Gfo/Idh/MocA family oxidoreductase [Luteitalea sp.]
MPRPVHIAFLGCGFITRVHCGHLRRLGDDVRCGFASRDRARAESYTREFGGFASYGSYDEAIADPRVDAVVVAVPTAFHLELTHQALAAGRHVLVEKPAFPTLADFEDVRQARDRAGRVVLVGENDHYKPLAVTLRRLLAEGAIGDLVLAHFVTVAHRLKTAEDWRNDLAMAGGDAFFEEGIHWLHVAGSLGPRIVEAHGYRPAVTATGPDRRPKSLLVALTYDSGAVGAIYYSREIPSLLRGLRVSKLFGRDGVITFESNGAFVVARRRGGLPRFVAPGWRDIRGYQAMYRDFVQAIRTGQPPEMRLERAIEDQRLMEQIMRTADRTAGAQVAS